MLWTRITRESSPSEVVEGKEGAERIVAEQGGSVHNPRGTRARRPYEEYEA
jgi:hypothetical protein